MANTSGSNDPRAAAAARLRRLIPIGAGLAILIVVILIATAPRSGRGVDATATTPDAAPAVASTSTDTDPPATDDSAGHGEAAGDFYEAIRSDCSGLDRRLACNSLRLIGQPDERTALALMDELPEYIELQLL